MDEQLTAYTVRRLTADDAAAIPELTIKVNGLGYIHGEVYHPERLLAMNRDGSLVSAVALRDSEGVVGHCALERPDLGRFAETGEAMVLPEHRHHHLLDKMRALLESEATQMGLVGLFGNAVTHHLFSQKSEEAAGGVPTGFLLGASPASAHQFDNCRQRVTLVTYFKYLHNPGSVTVYLPQHHQEIAARIFGRLGREVKFGAPRDPDAPGRLTSANIPEKQQGTIRVLQPGTDSVAAIREAFDALVKNSGAEVLFIDLPMNNPGMPALCAELERMGFFFCGIDPRDTEDSDVLRLQFIASPLDLGLVLTASDFGRDILSYIDSERQRVAG